MIVEQAYKLVYRVFMLRQSQNMAESHQPFDNVSYFTNPLQDLSTTEPTPTTADYFNVTQALHKYSHGSFSQGLTTPISVDVTSSSRDSIPVVISAFIGAFGCVTNIVTVLVFLKQGVKDCVTLCLLSLALTDFSSVALGMIISITSLSRASEVTLYIDLDALEFVLAYPSAMFYDISTSTTALITVQRCLCVTLPFRFKDFMTIKRTTITIICLFIFNVGMYMPHFLSSRLESQLDPRTNSTRVVLALTVNRPEVDLFLNTFVHLLEAALCLAIVLVSTQIMIIGLRRSSKFQKTGISRGTIESPDLKQTIKGPASFKKRTGSTRRASGKNGNVVKTVLILAMLCFLCNSIRFTVVVLLRVFPDIYYGRAQEQLFLIFLKLTSFTQTFNSSVHIIVYYIFNASFRRTINEFLRISKAS